MSSKFFTNIEGNTLFKKFEGVLKNNPIVFFDALVGYFRSSGYFKLRPFLEDMSEIRILVGINADKLIAQAQQKGLLYLEDKTKTKAELLESITEDIDKAPYKAEIEEGIKQFLDDIISGKVKIRAYGQKKLHAKFYILRPMNFNKDSFASVIMGSSNLTDAGLGINNEANYELNVQLNNYDDVKFALDEFEPLWKQSTELIPADIEELIKTTYLTNEILTPYELYLKMLIEYFGDEVILDNLGNEQLPEGYANLQYQADAVNEGFCKLMKHNGFILADVVGLGKTVIATRVIRKYIAKNGHNTKVLVIYPNALEVGWKTTIKDFGISNYVDFISNGSLHKLFIDRGIDYQKPEEYDLIVVDEAHKFRSSNTIMYEYLDILCKTPRICTGNDMNHRKKVMLISATPINNRPDDIANQIFLFQNARSSTIQGVPNLKSFFVEKSEKYKALKGLKGDELIKKVKDIYDPIREKVFKELVIRRTRADLKKIERYNEDITSQGLLFPKIEGPNKIAYDFTPDQVQTFYNTITAIVDKLGYYRYRAIEFLVPEFADLYDNAQRVSLQLARIMKTLLVKRLESSFVAFSNSLHRFYKSNERMIEMFANDKVYIAPDLDINKFLEDGREEELDAKIEALSEKSPNNRIFKAKDFSKELLEGLKKDQLILKELLEQWESIGEDPKLQQFLYEVNHTFFNENNVEKKLVIFSESTETVEYLASALKRIGREDVLAVSAKNNKNLFGTIRRNFDANYSEEQENRYNIIITTEVLAEGVNLHRSNVILNYDIPWNATRLMQRIGRVNRIGSKADRIYVYNFFPTAQSNKLIELNEKALKKLQSFHTALGEDAKVYTEEEEVIDNVLGDLQPQEEIDERLQYLEMIRMLYRNDLKTYQRIKKLPLKSRVARLADVKKEEAISIIGQPINNAVLCYLRNQMKEGFYVANDNNCVEITFYQAIKLFEASKKEKPITLEKQLFAPVNRAIENFKEVYNRSYSNEEYNKHNLNSQEKKVISLLKGLLDMKQQAQLTDSFVTLIETAKKSIYRGTFKRFLKEGAQLASLQKKNKYPISQVVEKISEIFSHYPFVEIARLDALRLNENQPTPIFEDPTIVLTETFA